MIDQRTETEVALSTLSAFMEQVKKHELLQPSGKFRAECSFYVNDIKLSEALWVEVDEILSPIALLLAPSKRVIQLGIPLVFDAESYGFKRFENGRLVVFQRDKGDLDFVVYIHPIECVEQSLFRKMIESIRRWFAKRFYKKSSLISLT